MHNFVNLFIIKPKLVRMNNTNYDPVECLECGVPNVYTTCGVCVDCHSRWCSNHDCSDPMRQHPFFVAIPQRICVMLFGLWRCVGTLITQHGERIGNMD